MIGRDHMDTKSDLNVSPSACQINLSFVKGGGGTE